jgi:hypothetical protein
MCVLIKVRSKQIDRKGYDKKTKYYPFQTKKNFARKTIHFFFEGYVNVLSVLIFKTKKRRFIIIENPSLHFLWVKVDLERLHFVKNASSFSYRHSLSSRQVQLYGATLTFISTLFSVK